MTIESNDSQKLEADVVVVGYGGAGATAAITAHDHGAQVIILEKMPVAGGTTRVTGGSFLTPTGMQAVDHINKLCQGMTEREIVETFVQNAMKNKDWLQEMGGETKVHSIPHGYPDVVGWPQVVGEETMEKRVVKGNMPGRNADRLWELFSTNVERRGITVMTNAPAKELITNEQGEVVGVVAERGKKKISIKAKKAVILTCGGFEYNEALKQAFLPCQPFYALGSPGNTGDGIRMAQKAGAALWHMTAVSCYLGFKAPEYEAAFSIGFNSERFIYVDRDGKRFANLIGMERHQVYRPVCFFDTSLLRYPRIPTYAIFDEVCRRAGPFYPGVTGYNRDYKWSKDNSEEIAKGWISKAETIRQLARQISVDESTLEETVARYNEYCKLGRDADFGRSKETLGPIEAAPYYAIELYPCLLNTQGGPRRDKEARVLDYDGQPIPRLYSAGTLGSLWGFLYAGAGNMAECLVFGRIAGRNAAAEKPLS